jgi:hypothetical protein
MEQKRFKYVPFVSESDTYIDLESQSFLSINISNFEDKNDTNLINSPSNSFASSPSQKFFEKVKIYIISVFKSWTDWDKISIIRKIIAVLELPFTILRVVTFPVISVEKDGNSWVRITLNCMFYLITVIY